MIRCAQRQKKAIKPFRSFLLSSVAFLSKQFQVTLLCLSTTHYGKLLSAFIENVFCDSQEIFYDTGDQ